MPAAAVIPAPLAYIKVVAVKKLVVEFWAGSIGMQSLRLPFVGLPMSVNWLYFPYRNPSFRHLIECEACRCLLNFGSFTTACLP